MARIRSLKPGFCKSDSIAALPRDARLHFAMLWTYADDAGRGVDNPKLIKGELWPLDDDVTAEVVEGWQRVLHRHGRIVRYEVDGRRYFEVTNWSEHQKPQHPKDSELPGSDAENAHEVSPVTGEKPHEDAPVSPTAVAPVVVVGAVEERELPSSSPSEFNREPPQTDDDEEVVHKATWLVAQWRLERREAERGPVGDPDSWLRTARKNARREVVDLLGQLGPGTTTDHLVEKLTRSGKPDPTESTAAAADAKRLRNEKPCADCGGMAILETDNGCLPCPKCNPDAA